jgi:hypothetical protein
MSNSSATTSSVAPTVEELLIRIVALEQQLVTISAQLETLTKPNNQSQKEMTDEHAYQILTGEYKDLKHNEAAQKLGLSYGQVYSCRGEYTFRHIHKKLMSQTPPWVNPWKKK